MTLSIRIKRPERTRKETIKAAIDFILTTPGIAF